MISRNKDMIHILITWFCNCGIFDG